MRSVGEAMAIGRNFKESFQKALVSLETGFSDKKISQLTGQKESIIKSRRKALKVRPVFKKVDTCAAEFKSFTPNMYSTYQRNFSLNTECESNPSNKKKIKILGGGPNRICLLYTSPSPRDKRQSRMPSSA